MEFGQRFLNYSSYSSDTNPFSIGESLKWTAAFRRLQTRCFCTITFVNTISTRHSALQNISAYSGKTYGEGSQHGLSVEFDLRRFISVVHELLDSKRGGGHNMHVEDL